MNRYRIRPRVKYGWSRSWAERLAPWFEFSVLVLWIGLLLFALTWTGR